MSLTPELPEIRIEAGIKPPRKPREDSYRSLIENTAKAMKIGESFWLRFRTDHPNGKVTFTHPATIRIYFNALGFGCSVRQERQDGVIGNRIFKVEKHAPYKPSARKKRGNH